MKVPLRWLSDYLALDHESLKAQAPELMKRLTAVGHMQDGPADEIGNDLVYDLEIRQNRSDCLSLLGVAREAAAVMETTLQVPDVYSAQLPPESGKTRITIENPELCYRFNALTIENIQLGESPSWLKEKLEAYGMKSVNNLVDITNYVMIEIGQPLHAFDADVVANQHLIVRSAQEGETFTALGEKKVTLTSDDLVIADAREALALAGVIGGEKSGVSAKTTRIILEAATYSQASVRRSTLRHSLRTEASTRLEKFLHPHLTQLALLRASDLIHELCGGNITGHFDAYPAPFADRTITMSQSALQKLSGVSLNLQEAQGFLAKIAIPSQVIATDMLEVQVPYFRTDVEQEADVVEEVIRMYGYDNIPAHLPSSPPPKNIQSAAYDLGEKVRDLLTAMGYDEQITEPLTSEDTPKREAIRLENSLTSEKVMLRTTLQPMLLRGLDYRHKHRHNTVRIFEVGKVYFQQDGLYLEKHTLGILASGKQVTYREVKGVVEELFIRLGYEFDQDLFALQTAPNDQQTYVVELDLEGLLKQKSQERVRVVTSPPQVILQDLSLLVPQEVPVGELLTSLKKVDSRLYSVELGEDPHTLGDQKTVFIRLAYHDPEKTLSDEDVQPLRAKILEFLQTKFEAQLR